MSYHPSSHAIENHAVDTSDALDNVFGLTPLFRYRFALHPRDRKDLRLHLLPDMTIDPLPAPLLGGGSPIDVEHLARHWD